MRIGTVLATVQHSTTKFVWLLVVLSLLIFLNPFLPYLGIGKYILNLLLTFIVLSGLLAASNERQAFRQLMVIGLITLVLDWLQTFALATTTSLGVVILSLLTSCTW